MLKANTVCAGAALAVLLCAPASATLITDPANDFLPTYLGAHGGDLDVLTASVIFDGTDFVFDSVQDGAVGTTPNGFYVWGIDRGAGTPRFGVISGTGTGGLYDASQVLFDSVLVIRPNATSNVNLLVGGTSTVLPAANITISGAELIARVPATLLPSLGFSFGQYGFNLWPRDGNVAGNGQIADFAPNNATFRATSVPEPNSLTLLALSVLIVVSLRLPKLRRAGLLASLRGRTNLG